jgi:Carboxylesterase family
MLGCNSDEGHLIFGGIASKFGFNPQQLDVAMARKVIGGFVSTFFTVPNAEKVIGAIVGQYLGDVDPNASSEDLHKILVEFLGDVLFVVPTVRTANNHSRKYLV